MLAYGQQIADIQTFRKSVRLVYYHIPCLATGKNERKSGAI